MSTHSQADAAKRDAEIELKQAEETSLPNELPNTPQNLKNKPEFGRTLGLLGAIAVVVIIIGLFAVFA